MWQKNVFFFYIIMNMLLLSPVVFSQDSTIEELLENAMNEAELNPSYQNYWKMATLADNHNKNKLAEKYYKACLEYKDSLEIYKKLPPILEALGKDKEAWKYRVERVRRELPLRRDLSFQKEVEAGVKTREELKSFLLEELEKEMSPETVSSLKDTLVAFKLIPESLDLKSFYTKLLTEQIGGFYNPESKRLYLISQAKKKSLWSRLFKSRRDDAEDRMVLAHEMTHALQDQHFDLLSLQKAQSSNDDKSLALTSLIEGDATLLMLEYSGGKLSAEDLPAYRMAFGLLSFLSPYIGGKELAAAPMIIRESLLFPYQEGFFFCLSIRQSNSWENIDRAYQNLPASTEHILHPKKYLEGNDPPLDFAWPDLSLFLSKEWQASSCNVMGELGCRIFLAEKKVPRHKNAAQGWGGDRYTVYRNPKGELALIWLSVWDSEKDADEFKKGYEYLITQKSLSDKSFSRTHLVRWGNRILVVEGFSEGMLSPIVKEMEKVTFMPPEK